MDYRFMAGDPTHPAARAVRAARAYANMSRKQLGDAIDVAPGTIGRWERGDWENEPPKAPMLETIARETQIHRVMDALTGETDPAKRFAAAARREAERRNGRRGSTPEAPSDEGAGGGAS